MAIPLKEIRGSSAVLLRKKGDDGASTASAAKKPLKLMPVPGRKNAEEIKNHKDFFHKLMDIRESIRTPVAKRIWERDGQRKRFFRGNFIFQSEDTVKSVFFVEHGSVGLMRYSTNGAKKKSIVNVVRANSLLGYRAYYASIYRPVTYRETAEAFETPTVVREFSRQTWQKLTENEPKLLERLLSVMALETGELMQFVSWMRMNAENRVGVALLWAANGDNVVRMRRTDMCDVFDLTKFTFARVLQKFEKRRLIQRDHDTVTVTEDLRNKYGMLMRQG